MNQNRLFDVATMGRRSHEDRFIIGTIPNTNIEVYGVFDGHGGHDVSDWLSSNILNRLGQNIGKVDFFNSTSMFRFLSQVIVDIDKELATMNDNPAFIGSFKKYEEQGSTIALLIVLQDTFYIINLGDSRTVIFDQTGEIHIETNDHSPKNESEKMRIIDAGGFVAYYDTARVNGDLSVSRSIADFHLKRDRTQINYTPDGPVSARPDIICSKKMTTCKIYALLGSDGIFEKTTSKTVIKPIVNQMNTTTTLPNHELPKAYCVLNAALSRTSDDLTAILVQL